MGYQPAGLALDIFRSRHAAHENETWDEACQRVAQHVSNAEEGEARTSCRSDFERMLLDNLFMPGGRIWYGSGRAKGQLLNCFVTGTQDSREGWGKTIYDSIVISGTGGGVGINCSPVRPRGTPIRGTGGVATGAVSLMEIINAAGEAIKAGGGRRTALMLCLSLSHGDIVEFLDEKLDKKKLNNANISVVFDEDPEEFFKLVKKGRDFPLMHQGRQVGSIPAAALWERIVANALDGGEPGLLNGYLANKMSNVWYVEPLTSTNPCQPAWATVLTPGGIRTMADVGIGDAIWSGKRWTKIVKKVSSGIKQVKAYRTRAGTFYGTDNHRILQYGEKVEVKDARAIDVAGMPEGWDWPTLNGPQEIVTIQNLGDHKVYDITVDDPEHTYWTDGLHVSNCGEIWLSPYDCCCLGALVLPRFLKADLQVDWSLLAITVKTGVRFLDDVLTVNQYPLPEIQQKCGQLRRIGLGITGLHHMLLELGLRYNSPEGLEFVDKLMKFIKNEAYAASSDLAAEKGSFPAFDPDRFLKGAFVKQLKPTLRSKIQSDGMRNCAVLTIAPTGTISMICDVSSGIEPVFAPAYERRFRQGDELTMEVVVDPMFQRFVADGRDVKHFQGTHDITIRDHMEMQRICQKHVDNAVSKTINLPAGTTAKELADLYVEYLPELKGVTVYPEGSRENQPLTPISIERALELAKDSATGIVADKCRGGVCEL